MSAGQIAIVDGADKHYYQPAWTLAAAGAFDLKKTERNERDLIPAGCEWVRDFAVDVDPKGQLVHLRSGLSLRYEALVVAPGLQLDWPKIEGCPQALESDSAGTVYEFNRVEDFQKKLEAFRGGRAIFVMPPVPIKCAGAPQKIMYLADDIFRRNGVRHRTEVVFTTPGKAMFGIPVFAEALQRVVNEREIKPLFQHRLIKVDAARKIATYEQVIELPVVPVAGSGAPSAADTKNPCGPVGSGPAIEKRQVELSYDLLHIVPPMSAPAWVAGSGLAFTEGDQKGWLKVDQATLQHLEHPSIFGAGDVTGVPNSKTGAAVRMQAPIVADNLMAHLNGEPLKGQYNGYSSCPLVTGFGKVILAEFGYGGKLLPTFPLDPTVERRLYWHLKKDLLPSLYWPGMLRGRA
jgi:sulfide:quinone oxidoreductase